MTKQEIISTLIVELPSIKPAFKLGERLWNEAYTHSLLIEFDFDVPSRFKDKRLIDIRVTSALPNDPDENIVYADDLNQFVIAMILGSLGMEEYATDMGVLA